MCVCVCACACLSVGVSVCVSVCVSALVCGPGRKGQRHATTCTEHATIRSDNRGRHRHLWVEPCASARHDQQRHLRWLARGWRYRIAHLGKGKFKLRSKVNPLERVPSLWDRVDENAVVLCGAPTTAAQGYQRGEHNSNVRCSAGCEACCTPTVSSIRPPLSLSPHSGKRNHAFSNHAHRLVHGHR